MNVIHINKDTPPILELDRQTIYELKSRRVYCASTGKLINRWVEIYLNIDIPCINYFHSDETALKYVQFMHKQAIDRNIPPPDASTNVYMGADASTAADTNASITVSTDMGTNADTNASITVSTDMGTNASTNAGTNADTNASTNAGTNAGTNASTNAGITAGASINMGRMRLNAPVFVPGKK
jgi:hypothetical protein